MGLPPQRVGEMETAATQAAELQTTLAAREEQLAASAQRVSALESELQEAKEKMGGTEGEAQALQQRIGANSQTSSTVGLCMSSVPGGLTFENFSQTPMRRS